MTKRLDLSPANRRALDISSDLIGIAVAGTYRHAACFPSMNALIAAIADEDRNVVVIDADDWKHSVGACDVCGGYNPDEPQ